MRRSPPLLPSLLLGLLLLAPLGAGRRLGAQPPPSPAQAPLSFVEVSEHAGLAAVHHKPVLDPKLLGIMPWMTAIGAAVAAADFNRDGWIDLFVTDSQQGQPDHLYRNNGDGTFSDVAAAAGVASLNGAGGLSVDCVWGDVDNDGWPDLYVVRWGRDVLLRNNGDGTFSDVTAARFRRADGSPGTEWKNGAAAIFLDYDRDGRLDLYVGNYFADFDLTHLATTRIMHESFETARNGGTNQLFHQLPDGSFREVGAEAGVADTGWTLAVGSGDLDDDGWPDLYVADDFGADQLYRNRGGRFENVSASALGVDTKKGMNVEVADFNGDGRLDVYVTNITSQRYLREGNMLWLNQGVEADGKLRFTDVGAEAGVADGGWGWGAKFFDADNDGDLDLFAANGFVSGPGSDYWLDLGAWRAKGPDPTDALAWPPIGEKNFSGFEPKRFWRNEAGTFVEQAAAVGLASQRDGRGVVVLDFDNDGDLDLFLANQGQPPQLFENRSATNGHWLSVSLEGAPAAGANRDAIGARVTAWVGAAMLVRERDGGNGFAGQSDPRLHFGLGAQSVVDRLEVRWPDGRREERRNVPADRPLVIAEAASPPP